MSARHLIRPGLAALALSLIAGCAPDDTMQKPGTWSLETYGSSNDANLRAMIADPEDLIHGRGEDTAIGAEAARPVAALEAGKRAPLPKVDSLHIDGTGSGQNGLDSSGGSP